MRGRVKGGTREEQICSGETGLARAGEQDVGWIKRKERHVCTCERKGRCVPRE